jgi:prepilin-type N-terminal cleavage/methylation domain-containing protein
MKFFKKTGFTLVEIVVVIGIMALLTTIIMTSLSGAKAQNRDQQRVADISSIKLALEMIFSHNSNNYYPASLSILVPTYLPSVPKGPNPGETYNYVPLNGDITKTKCSSYHLWTTLETHNPALNDKKGFDSTTQSLCVPGELGAINAASSTNSFVYDVTPQ